MEVVLPNQVCVNPSSAQAERNIATLVATRIVRHLLKFVPQRVQFFVLMELVLPILPFAVLLQLVAPRIQIAVDSRQSLVPKGIVWQPKLSVHLHPQMQLETLSEHHNKDSMRIQAVVQTKSCAPTVNVFLKTALMLVKSFPLARSERTNGGMEVVKPVRVLDFRPNHVPPLVLSVAKMGGVVTKRWGMMVARTTRKHGIIVQIATAPTVLASAVGLRVEILQHILDLIPRASMEHVVAYLQLLPVLLLAFLMQQNNATQ